MASRGGWEILRLLAAAPFVPWRRGEIYRKLPVALPLGLRFLPNYFEGETGEAR